MLFALLAAALISVSSSSTSQSNEAPVVFAPIEGEIETRRCDPRPCLVPQPQSAHAYEGQFSAQLQPQMNCIRAPCPQGGTIVTLPDGSPVRVGRIGYARGTPANLRVRFDRANPTIRYEGKLWITLDNKMAIIAPTRAEQPRLPAKRSPHPAQ